MSKTVELYPNSVEDWEATVALCHQRIDLLTQDRERIKRDLHDGILQTLYSLGLNMAAAKLLMAPAQPEAAGQVDLASAQLDRAIREIRQFLKTDLGTREEEAEPLERQIRALVENITRTMPVACRVELDSHAIELIPQEYRRQVLYILRESMSNCVRHARPGAVIVSCTAEASDEVTLVVEDDGTGFTNQDPVRHRHGLKNLMTRANQIGGRLYISSIPGHGTRVTLKLDLSVPCLQSGTGTVAK